MGERVGGHCAETIRGKFCSEGGKGDAGSYFNLFKPRFDRSQAFPAPNNLRSFLGLSFLLVSSIPGERKTNRKGRGQRG